MDGWLDGWWINGLADEKGWGGGAGLMMGKTLDNVNTNTHHGGAGHSWSVLARAELSARETPAPPPGEGWCWAARQGGATVGPWSL